MIFDLMNGCLAAIMFNMQMNNQAQFLENGRTSAKFNDVFPREIVQR